MHIEDLVNRDTRMIEILKYIGIWGFAIIAIVFYITGYILMSFVWVGAKILGKIDRRS